MVLFAVICAYLGCRHTAKQGYKFDSDDVTAAAFFAMFWPLVLTLGPPIWLFVEAAKRAGSAGARSGQSLREREKELARREAEVAQRIRELDRELGL